MMMMMKKKKKETSISEMAVSSDHQSPKSRRPKSREVSSRFLSPTSTTSSVESGGLPSPNRALSPTKRKASSSSSSSGFSSRKHQSAEEISSIRGLWPASNSSSSKKSGTLADHLGNDRLKDLLERENGGADLLLSRQKSSSEFRRFIRREDNSKENHRPIIIPGSARYTGKSNFLSSNNFSNSSVLPHGRFSVDENIQMIRKISSQRTSDSFSDVISSESECSDVFSSTDNNIIHYPAIGKNSSFSSSLSSKTSSRRSGMEVSSRYMRPCNRRGSSVSNISTTPPNITTSSSENFQNPSGLLSKNVIGRASSMRVYGTVTSQWALSPARSGSPPLMSVENKGKRVVSFSNLKPPNSPSKSKGVGNLLNLGLELFKSKTRSSSSSSSSSLSLTARHGLGEDSHMLQLLYCRLLQWRYVNARATDVDASKKALAESSLLNAWASLSKLQLSIVQKHVNFNKEKLELKLNTILCSQVQPLEAWGDMESQHVSAVSMTKDCSHSVVCRVPLIEGAKADPQPASVAIRNATDLTASVKTMLTDFSPAAQKTAFLLSELAEVVSREKSLLEECFELLELVSALEMQERSLKCSIIQLKSQHPQQRQQQSQQQEIVL